MYVSACVCTCTAFKHAHVLVCMFSTCMGLSLVIYVCACLVCMYVCMYVVHAWAYPLSFMYVHVWYVCMYVCSACMGLPLAIFVWIWTARRPIYGTHIWRPFISLIISGGLRFITAAELATKRPAGPHVCVCMYVYVCMYACVGYICTRMYTRPAHTDVYIHKYGKALRHGVRCSALIAAATDQAMFLLTRLSRHV